MGAASPRYVAFVKLAAGGAATVFVAARADAPDGELVALKRPHPHVLDDPRQRAALLREAEIASAIRHPNVVPVRDIHEIDGEIELVLDYVEGASLASLIAGEASHDSCVPPAIAARILLDACAGLTAVHSATDANGKPLGLVHRDVSPQNILVGTDGIARLTDFGLAKAIYEGAPSTTQGTLKGKLGYMAPEYVSRGRIEASGDVFALGVVAWEAFAGRRLFRGDNEAQTLDHVLRTDALPLASVSQALAPLDAAIAHAVAKEATARVATAAAFAEALESGARVLGPIASHAEVGAYVARVTQGDLLERRARIEEERRAIRARIRSRRTRIGATVAIPLAAATALALYLGSRPAPLPSAAAMPLVVAAPSVPSASSAPGESSAPTNPPPTLDASTAVDAAAAPPAARPLPRHHAPPAPTRVPPPNPYVHPSSAR
jgi:serine/threonine-protein kinase